MRKVTRTKIPNSLATNSYTWTCELLNEIGKKGTFDKVDDSFKNKLDPCCDIIEKHLVLDLTTGMYDEDKSSARGKTTIDHTGMNREGLVKARRNKLLELAMNYKEYKNNGNEQRFIDYYNILKEDLDYPSVYEAFLEEIK